MISGNADPSPISTKKMQFGTFLSPLHKVLVPCNLSENTPHACANTCGVRLSRPRPGSRPRTEFQTNDFSSCKMRFRRPRCPFPALDTPRKALLRGGTPGITPSDHKARSRSRHMGW